MTCTSIEDVDLNWDDFAKKFNLIYFIITLLEHTRTKFPNLLHFLDSRVVYKGKKGILLVNPYRIPTSLDHMNGKNKSMKMGP
jgi:hypothetical protein